MLFNSAPFILVFLPIALLGFRLLLWRADSRWVTSWLLLLSLFFYGYWDWRFLPVLIVSILANYAIGALIQGAGPAPRRHAWLVAGLALNLGALFVFKYADFAAEALAAATRWQAGLVRIALPIGISFYTFQQVAYVVDVWRGVAVERDFLRYALFVSFFPQLIAGPIVHHGEVTPQLGQLREWPFAPDLAVGLSIFAMGLAKKIFLAASFALVASPVFDRAAADGTPGLAAAWLGVLAYGLQIYFDFSAYSDMAIGLGRMFGIVLPINFASPYKSRSVIEFWRRWHITLSRFLKAYLYIPLGGNRRGPVRRLVNIFVTMLLGGIWHGAGWTFVLWGAVHGVLILINHVWRERRLWRLPEPLAWALTLLAVMLAWIPFRAADLPTTARMALGLLGAGGWIGSLPAVAPTFGRILDVRLASGAWASVDWSLVLDMLAIGLGLALALAAPNTQTLMARVEPGLASDGYPSGIEPRAPDRQGWRPVSPHALVLGVLLAVCLLKLNDVSEFIYFQF